MDLHFIWKAVVVVFGGVLILRLAGRKSISQLSGIPLTLGMILYLPQFFFDQPLRVTHGILVAVGCVWIPIELWRGSYRKADPKSQSNTVHL
ncbi:hypothetical protein ACERJO_06710 [Halalkalibacter sp. AB-rgal2]|uniref:hypothetical protein n=1 Tax=Halalkalibacter sp. AB-rgal2 TaxID=3242695 RepID=UPI00359E758F